MLKHLFVTLVCPGSSPCRPRRGFTVLEFLLYTAGLLLLVQAVCVAARLTMQVASDLPPYVDLVRMHLPAVRQLYRDADRKDVEYTLEKGCLYRKPKGGRRICIARGVASISHPRSAEGLGTPGSPWLAAPVVADKRRLVQGPNNRTFKYLDAGQASMTDVGSPLHYTTTSGWHIEEKLHATR